MINEDFKNTKFIIKCHHFTIVKAWLSSFTLMRETPKGRESAPPSSFSGVVSDFVPLRPKCNKGGICNSSLYDQTGNIPTTSYDQ